MKHRLLIKEFIPFLLLILVSTVGYTQDKTPTHSRPITISVFNEATTLPFTHFFSTPVHPGIMAGTAFFYNKNKQHQLSQTINIGYFYHRDLMQAILLNSEFSYQYRSKFGVSGGLQAGPGYLHAFKTATEYKLIDGKYQQAVDKGSPKAIATLGLDLGMYVRPADIHSPRVFVKYQAWIEYPFSSGFIPLMSHTNLHIGFTFFPFSK